MLSVGGIEPVKRLFCKYSSFNRFPGFSHSQFGIDPERLLELRSSDSKLTSFDNDSGSDPTNRLNARDSFLRLPIWTKISIGNSRVNLLDDISNDTRDEQAENSAGTGPVTLLKERSSSTSVEHRSVTVNGICPVKWLPERYTYWREPEGREGTGPENWLPETLRYTRLLQGEMTRAMSPKYLLAERSRYSKEEHSPKGGMATEKLLEERSKCWRLWQPEKSVSPVSLLALRERLRRPSQPVERIQGRTLGPVSLL